MNRITILTAVSILVFYLMSQAQAINKDSIFPKGKLTPANFTGNVWVQPLVAQDSTFNLVAGSITFSPGSRRYWHTHNAGQILMILNGTG